MSYHFIIPFWYLACSEYSFQADKNRQTPEDNSVPTEPTDWESEMECPQDWELSTPLEQSEVCQQEQEIGTLDIVVEWNLTSYQDYIEWGQTVMAPMIGQLTDDNGDGILSSEDDPDIVVITDDDGAFSDRHGVIRILRGYDGAMVDAIAEAYFEDSVVHPYRYSNIALGDIDADGSPEIVLVAEVIGGLSQEEQDTGIPPDTANPSPSTEPAEEPTDNPISPHPPSYSVTCRVVALDPELQVEWIGPVLTEGCGGHAPAIADLDGNGRPEVLLGPYIISGHDGGLIAKGADDQGRNPVYAEIGMHSIATDLDGDGQQELLAGRSIYNAQGVTHCTNDATWDGFTAAADFQGDGLGEVLLVGGGEISIFDHQCQTIQRWTLPGIGTGGPPTIADYNGDGFPEIGIVDGQFYSVYQADGTLLWNREIIDSSSHATGSIVFDFEGDGFPEVVYADEQNLWVFDGLNGSVRLQFSDHSSRTLHEYPTIADVDKDGSAEIIVVNGGGHDGTIATGISVLGSQSSNWPSARMVWNQHAYHITNVNDDLSIPAEPMSNWPAYNNFRSGDVSLQMDTDLPDALLDVDLCLDECEQGKILFAVQVGNQGLVDLIDTTEIMVFTDEDQFLTSQALGEILSPMERSQPILFELDSQDIRNEILLLEISVEDCDNDNNRHQLEGVSCAD